MNDELREPQNDSEPQEQLGATEQTVEVPLSAEEIEQNAAADQEIELQQAQERVEKAEREALIARTTFHLLPDVFTLLRLPVEVKQLPDFVWKSSFYTISRSPDELSLVCEERLVVRNIDHYGLGNIARIDGNWRILRLGVMDLSLVGIAAKFSGVLAEAGININIISTYNTDYVMVKQAKLSRALTALREAGYTVE
ncbi:MAG: ACT domain-containing protein [Candidatus Kapabacteria bacterium]|nr:ACT domain-containing protein [Candidatus Kapabacteria bacterium]